MKRPRVGYPHSQDTSFVYVADPKFIDEDASLMFYWRFIYRYKHEYVCLSVRPTRLDIKYDMFWRSIVPPSDFEYDKAFIGDEVDDWTEQYDACIAPGDLKRLGAGFVGLRPYQVDPVSRRKRAVANTTQSGVGGNADSDNPLEAPYYIRIMAFNCATWNGVKEDWDPDNCEVEKDLLKNWTTCLCQQDNNQVLTASSFFTPPNSIDFSTVFSKFDIQSQAAVLATILIITLVAILAGLWGHWRDSRDKLQWGVTLLADNYDDDDYYYLVTVYTGLVLGAGTTSNINFNLSGERGDTGIRTLSDGVRKEFETGSVMHFLMAVPQPLGLLQCFRVWHDNSGKGKKASWYLNRIEIHDIQTNDRYDFMCSGWLSVEDGTIERMVHVSGTVNFNNFKTMFYEHARSHVTDDHLWLSVFLRPVKSHFYRSQRVGCCYALLMLTMITNAMFFQIKDQKNRIQPSEIELGPIRFSVNQLYISFVSILITSLPIFLVILLFRKSKLSVKQKKSIREIPSWYPKFMKKQIEHSNKLEEALVIRDIVDDKEGVLPHFCVYFGWFVVFLAAFLSAFFLILYSAEWGQSISEEWLTSFFLSFIQSIVLVDPFKVIVMAVIFAIFLKAIRSNKPTHYDLKEIQLLAKHKGLPNSGRKILKFSSPYSDQQFYQMKLQRERNDRMRKIVKELAVNALFLWFLLSISYSNRDVNSYFLDRYVENNFITPAYKSSGRTFESVGSRETYFEWLNDTVLPRMFKERDYRGYRMVSSARMFSYYLNNFRVGPPRLRQVRTKQTFCDWKYMNESRCIPGYWMTEEDTDTYCIGWTDTPCAEHEKLALTHESWTFTSASDIWGYPISGYHNTYGGGGYIANLDINKLISFESLKELHAARWIDRHTRAVFFEFTLYNVNLNIFVYVTLLTEFPETGGALNFKNVFPFRPSQHEGANAKYVLFCEIALLVYIIIYVIMIIIDLAKERLRYFRSFWNVVEVTMMAVAIITIAMYAIREKFTSDALAKYADNNRLFVNFYHVALWDGIFVMFLGLLTAIATLRLIKALGHSKLTIKIYTVLWQSSRVLPGLAFYIITMLLSFSFAGLLLFGRMSTGYKSFFYCLETLFTAVMGSPYFKHTNTEVQDYWITILYFCLFVVLVGLTMQNLFLAILLDVMAFSENPDVDEAEVDMELISYIWQSFLSVFTGRQPDMERKKGLTALRVHHEEIGVGGTIEDKLKAYKRPHFYKPGANKNKTEVEMELVDDDDSIDELPYISSSFGDNDDDNNDNAYKINDHAKDNGENDKEKTEINDKIKSENESDA
ncbi:hypothetical protein LOTGIDRAFT_156607 [Lottia gigantea]|uniref:PLAT domain-containing protein n=1 Tax=Lottia gigantea TaxID=225164 RepID=V4AIR4_LOTGI|nr:hypothetical protein LOTGIDRAFT_156607 [Lottia gigantea]ESP04004.1 hypothetical protein LOTGIDRAFT_156607 [Lottia gigantea]